MKKSFKFFTLTIILSMVVSILFGSSNLSFAATTPGKIAVVVTNDPSTSVKIQIQKDDGSPSTKEETNVMNIAPNGTGYVWSNNSDASSNSNKAVAAAVNDNNTSTSASCTSSSASKWNGAGVTFSTSQNGITKVEFINGDISDGDGIFEGNCKLQFSTDGSTWSDSNWSISPDYPYNETASGAKYTFSGTTMNNIKGVRVLGQVRINDMSYFFKIKELNVYTGSGSTTPTLTATAQLTVTPTPTATSTTPPQNGLNMPFGQNINYPNCIKPNFTQEQLNADIKKYYDQWKSLLVKQTKDGKTMYYVKADGTGDDNPNRVSHSEAHGYGMMITALMAGYETNAKEIFDGFYNVYSIDKSPGKNTMNWEIQSDLSNSGEGSATDGDLDVAYALLLADKQWGSNGQINYLEEAKKMIEDIKQYDINHTFWSVKCADSDWPSTNTTRPSDWMADHFRAFQSVTGDLDWKKVTNKIYGIISDVKIQGISTSGLVPDFLILKSDNALKAATDSEIGGGESNCGDYSYNACRVPWRLATDYAHYGTSEAKAALNDMLNTIKKQTAGDPAKINDGYKLDGSSFSSDHSLAFTSPLLAACITDSSNQDYINKGWNYIKAKHNEYYGDTINLMCMLLISGNWWSPDKPATTNYNIDINHDGAINMADVMLLAVVFNSVRNDSKYVESCDLNRDGSINMLDVMLIAAKFNTLVS